MIARGVHNLSARRDRVDVKPHQSAADSSSAAGASYDVSIRVADTLYLTLYTDTLGIGTVRYAAGQELLVHIGKNTITFNDILGRSQEVPIVSRKPFTSVRQPK